MVHQLQLNGKLEELEKEDPSFKQGSPTALSKAFVLILYFLQCGEIQIPHPIESHNPQIQIPSPKLITQFENPDCTRKISRNPLIVLEICVNPQIES